MWAHTTSNLKTFPGFKALRVPPNLFIYLFFFSWAFSHKWHSTGAKGLPACYSAKIAPQTVAPDKETNSLLIRAHRPQAWLNTSQLPHSSGPHPGMATKEPIAKSHVRGACKGSFCFLSNDHKIWRYVTHWDPLYRAEIWGINHRLLNQCEPRRCVCLSMDANIGANYLWVICQMFLGCLRFGWCLWCTCSQRSLCLPVSRRPLRLSVFSA